MTKKTITGILLIALMATVLFMNFASAPGAVSKVEIKDKHDEHIFVVPGAQFCVERTLRNKDIENISPVMVPLFSEGATLESIDIKHVTEEAYLEDVPDWETCQRTVGEPLPQYDEPGCASFGYSWNGTTCYLESTEDYPCITGYHQEERIREVISYEPVLQGQYRDGEDSNEDEYVVEIFRSGLPDDVRALENIGYSTSFDLEDEATIRMCFRAPGFGSGITSGRISYMTYYGSGYDFESTSWWDASWGYRKEINISSVTANTNYQIKVTDNLSDEYAAGKINSICKDIRFTNASDSPILLHHWIENCNVTEGLNSTFWVNLTAVKAGNVAIYMYYGNPSANSTSSGNETFILYDHFDSMTSLWTNQSGGWSVSNSEMTTGDGSTKLFNGVLRGVGNLSLRLRSRADAYGADGFAAYVADPTGDTTIYVEKTTTAISPFFRNTVYYASRGPFTGDTASHVFDYHWNANFVELHNDSTLLHNETTYPADETMFVLLRGQNHWDWVVLRKYMSPEPIVTIGGAENGTGGGGGSGYIIRTSSDNLILSPASGTTEVNGSIYPQQDNISYLGGASLRWRYVYAQEVVARNYTTGDMHFANNITLTECGLSMCFRNQEQKTIMRLTPEGGLEVAGSIKKNVQFNEEELYGV